MFEVSSELWNEFYVYFEVLFPVLCAFVVFIVGFKILACILEPERVRSRDRYVFVPKCYSCELYKMGYCSEERVNEIGEKCEAYVKCQKEV